ncbi:MAG TPA: DUF2752 domain-containing protein [Candidatus Krumholzibacteria bacterium]|nr:DUF2752 domain-containing protein [Candidatus Krumholzibacteria bacterium]HPD71138.1 DUF2752 domain-containing protein [Candidatus Krumholzibacteria bacterium]HRY39162.1 DUF2752 domain-containing protein [Candidatus Krumholzibacteria bacterium]
MRLGAGDAPLARQLGIAAAILLPLGIRWLAHDPAALSALTGPCPLRALSGLPCPTCGGTRALVALADGRLVAAVADNALVTVAVLAVAAWSLGALAATVVPAWRRRIVADAGDRRRLVVLGGGLIAAGWVWLLL